MRTTALRLFRTSSPRSTWHPIYTDKHEEMRKTIHQLIDKEINPYVREWENKGLFPAHRVFKHLGDLGVLGINKPEKFGGLGLDFSYAMLVGEALGHCDVGGVTLAVNVQTDMATPALTNWGSDELREEFLRPTIAGDYVSCIAVSEQGGGSDVAAIRTNARFDGDDMIINGSKMWITNGTQADWACVLVNTNKKKSMHRNKSLVCVRMDEPGVQRSKKIEKIGMRCSDTAEIFFDDVRVPRKNIIGEEGRGFVYQMMQFQDERLAACAPLLVILQRCIDKTIEYTADRRAFGKPLQSKQVIQYQLAELQTDLEALKALTYLAVRRRLEGEEVTKLGSMIKLKSGRLSRKITDRCLQFWGGLGFTTENFVSQIFRDYRVGSIAGGADEVMLSIISKSMGMEKKRQRLRK